FSKPLQTLALSPDRKLLAIIGYITKPPGPGVVPAGPGIVLGDMYYPEPFIRIWDIDTGKEVRRFGEPGHEKKAEDGRGFKSVDFTADGKTLLASAVDGALYACSLAGAQEPRRVWRGPGRISAIAASPNGKIAAVATGSTVYLIDVASGKDVF